MKKRILLLYILNEKFNKTSFIRQLNDNSNKNFYLNFYFEHPENIKIMYYFDKKEIIR